MTSLLNNAQDATMDAIWRGVTTTALMSAYSVGVLGNPLSGIVLLNGALIGASAATSQFVVKEILPISSAGLSGSVIHMVGESAGASGLYSMLLFPRAFPGSSVPRQELMMVAFGADLASQLLSPKLQALVQSSGSNTVSAYA